MEAAMALYTWTIKDEKEKRYKLNKSKTSPQIFFQIWNFLYLVTGLVE